MQKAAPDRQIFRGGFFFDTPIGFDLTAVDRRTIDIGFRQHFGSAGELHAAVFYKYTSGQIQIARQAVSPWANIQPYYYMTNQGSSAVRGIDIAFSLDRTRYFKIILNYSFTDARGASLAERDTYATLYRRSWSDTSGLDYNTLYPLISIRHTKQLWILTSAWRPTRGGGYLTISE